MKSGDFFAIDRHAWARVCDRGLNEAVAYLILARGTGGDNRTTSWSVNAIEERTGISRPRATTALKLLITEGLVEQRVSGTRPRYWLPPATHIPGSAVCLSAADRDLIGKIDEAGCFRIDRRRKLDLAQAERLVVRGYLRAVGDEFVVGEVSLDEPRSEWIWLPNAIADWNGDRAPPIEILRQSHSIDAVRMLINLYADHDIRDDAGLPWRPDEGVRRLYEREKINERGEYAVWGFFKGQGEASNKLLATTEHRRVHGNWDGFWDAVEILLDIGILQFVTHLVSAHDAQGEVIHPLPIRKEGEAAELRLAAASHKAAEAMVPAHVETGKYWAIAAVKRHVREVQLVGIARLRHRPQTSATAAWTAKCVEWERWTKAYEKLEREARGEFAEPRVLATSR